MQFCQKKKKKKSTDVPIKQKSNLKLLNSSIRFVAKRDTPFLPPTVDDLMAYRCPTLGNFYGVVDPQAFFWWCLKFTKDKVCVKGQSMKQNGTFPSYALHDYIAAVGLKQNRF